MANILVIDDDDQFRQMIASMLAADRHHVSQAADGEEGLHLVASVRPDLVVTDIMMPKMDGIEFVTALKRQGISVPVIVMSGGRRAISAEFNLNSAALMGVTTTLPKPFSREDLRRAIGQALG